MKIEVAKYLWLKRHLGMNVGACSSPIEELFMWAVLNVDGMLRASSDYHEHLTHRRADISPSSPHVAFTVSEDAGTTTQSRIAVELDGHEFHERTKEQASRDKARDRAIVAAGWHVMRFAGSDVYADAGKCVEEVLEFAAKEPTA